MKIFAGLSEPEELLSLHTQYWVILISFAQILLEGFNKVLVNVGSINVSEDNMKFRGGGYNPFAKYKNLT